MPRHSFTWKSKARPSRIGAPCKSEPFAAGRLSRRDADRVEQALAGNRELARRYELVRRELTETIYLNETLGGPSARAAEKLFAAIDAEEADGRPRRPRRLSRTPLVTASTRDSAGEKPSLKE